MGWMYCVLALHGEYKEARDMRFLSGKKNRELKRASGGRTSPKSLWVKEGRELIALWLKRVGWSEEMTNHVAGSSATVAESINGFSRKLRLD